jgi:hypothetical protein
VIRQAWSSGGRQVYLVTNGQELLRDMPASDQEIIEQLRSVTSALWPFPVLVEEFLRAANGQYRMLVDYKFHCFNGQVGAIAAQAGRRIGQGAAGFKYYDEHWRVLPESLRTNDHEHLHFDKPASFNEMLECARVLSRSYEGYVRIDLYDTDRGCVFGELASFPSSGKHFSSYADSLLGEYWSRYCNDQI